MGGLLLSRALNAEQTTRAISRGWPAQPCVDHHNRNPGLQDFQQPRLVSTNDSQSLKPHEVKKQNVLYKVTKRFRFKTLQGNKEGSCGF